MTGKAAPPIMTKAQAAEVLAAQEAVRKRAARQAANIASDAAPPAVVTVRVLPMGDGKVSMGVHAAQYGEAHYDKGETFDVAEDIAKALEARGYVEIQGAA